jgi:hypothetical protein
MDPGDINTSMRSFKRFLIETYTYITETAFWPDWARSGSMVSAIRNNTPIVGHVAHVQIDPEYPDEGYRAHILTDGGHVHTFFFPKSMGSHKRGDTVDLYPFLERVPGAERPRPSIRIQPDKFPKTVTYDPAKDLPHLYPIDIEPEYERYQGRADDIGTHVETGEPIIGSITGKPAESVFKFYQFMKDQLEY